MRIRSFKRICTLKVFEKIFTAQNKEEYKSIFEKTASLIKNGAVIEIKTLYGKRFVGKITEKNVKNSDFDIICNDLLTIEKYAFVSKAEILALGSFEKPFVRLKTKPSFKELFAFLEKKTFRFKLADDLILYLLSQELHQTGENLFFITEDHKDTKVKFSFKQETKDLKPIECTVKNDRVVILKGNRSVSPPMIKESEKSGIAIYLSKNYSDKILLFSEKFGVVEYLSFDFDFSSIENVFEEISNMNKTGKKLVENYKNQFEKDIERISKIKFHEKNFNVYKLWGIISIILGYSQENDLKKAAHVIEENVFVFNGKKGPRIDYKLQKTYSRVSLNPLWTIRTAMSFRLAGIDEMTLSYGIVESFAEFISNEVDDIKNDMDFKSLTINGTLLEVKPLFDKLYEMIGKNHKLYFNRKIPFENF